MKRKTLLTLGAVATAAVIGVVAIPAIAQGWGGQRMMQQMHGAERDATHVRRGGGQMGEHRGHGQMGTEGGHGAMNMRMGGMADHPLHQSFDADGDGTVTTAEMKAGMAALHARFDADGNGALSREEFAALVEAQGSRAAGRPFAMLDADGDGQISVEEMAFPAQMMARMNRMHGAATDADIEHH